MRFYNSLKLTTLQLLLNINYITLKVESKVDFPEPTSPSTVKEKGFLLRFRFNLFARILNLFYFVGSFLNTEFLIRTNAVYMLV